jgi:hypothetical protein
LGGVAQPEQLGFPGQRSAGRLKDLQQATVAGGSETIEGRDAEGRAVIAATATPN